MRVALPGKVARLRRPCPALLLRLDFVKGDHGERELVVGLVDDRDSAAPPVNLRHAAWVGQDAEDEHLAAALAVTERQPGLGAKVLAGTQGLAAAEVGIETLDTDLLDVVLMGAVEDEAHGLVGHLLPRGKEAVVQRFARERVWVDRNVEHRQLVLVLAQEGRQLLPLLVQQVGEVRRRIVGVGVGVGVFDLWGLHKQWRSSPRPPFLRGLERGKVERL